MTSQEEKYFEALTSRRRDFSANLEDEDYRGIKDIIIEKYSDQAHFIYELLQNADDAEAARAEFILDEDKLIFKHNGKIKFTITDPDTPATQSNARGHINAITAIGNSNKENKIGKFGIGFKAVFQYTDTPEIYESHVAFRIENFIVPVRLKEYDVGDETVFVFPFNKENCPKLKAFYEISEKLRALESPLLFLSNLQEIIFDIEGTVGSYKKEIKDTRIFGDTTAELLSLTDGKAEAKKLWLFSRKDGNVNYCVGYFRDDKNHLKPVDKPAFCFFPTKRVTKLKFIIHAPFLLTASREGIKAGLPHNERMIDLLAALAADSLIYLRDIGGLIDDGILEIIPIKESDFLVASDEISFKPFFTVIKKKMQTEKLLPTQNGYVSSKNAYWAEVKRYTVVFSDEQLRTLVDNPQAAWVFTTISRRESDKVIKDYADSITQDFITEENLFRYIDEEFIENQSIDWLHEFYKWLAEPKANRFAPAGKKPFFLTDKRKAVAAFDGEGEPILFLSNDDAPDLAKIHPDLLKNPDTEKFLKESIGLGEPTIADEIYNKLGLTENEIKYISGNFIEDQDFKWLHRFYKWLSERTNRIETAKTSPFFLDENSRAVAAFADGKPKLFLPNDSGYPSIHPDLLKNPDIKKFLEKDIEIKAPSLKDEINEKIKPKYDNCTPSFEDTFSFQKIFSYYDERCPYNEANKFISDLKSWIKLRTLSKSYDAPNNLYMPEPELIECFDAVVVKDAYNPSSKNKFLNINFYLQLVGANKEDRLREFFKQLGVTDEIDDLKSRIKLRTLSKSYVAPNNLYMPKPELIEYFDAVDIAKNSASYESSCLDSHKWHFLDIDFYLKLVDANVENILREFFKKLDVADEVRYLQKDFFDEQVAEKYKLSIPDSKWMITWRETVIHGCITLLEDIGKNENAQFSFLLWKRLLSVNDTVDKLKNHEKGSCRYYRRYAKKESNDSYLTVTVRLLKETAWLVDKNGDFKKPEDITVYEMADEYDTTSDSAQELIKFLGIILEVQLTAEQRQLLNFGQKYKEAQEAGIDVEAVLAKAIADKKRKEDETDAETITQPSQNDSTEKTTGDPANTASEKDDATPLESLMKKISPTIKEPQPNTDKPTPTETTAPDDFFKEAIVDYGKKLKNIKEKRKTEEEEIEKLKELQQKVLDAAKYSFGWCKALLDLEIQGSRKNNFSSKEIFITFGHVERIPDTQRTLILKYPNRYIPQFMEDLENIELILRTAKTENKVVIEVAGVRNNTLSVKLKDPSKLDGINLGEVIEASISASNPVFLLEELKREFSALGFGDNYDMKANLCENIEFIFGPPGTGKTHNLAQKIIELISDSANKKILVLTPTNKAADVIVNKIMELNTDKTYTDWLLRFGTTNDVNVEKSGVFHDKTFNINSKSKNVTVTTIARFPYDYFMPVGERIYLREMYWDYIIIDEASMIMLAQILLPLYKKEPKEFIIAGDPFQIEPVTEIDLWKGENIYTLVGLNSFTATKTEPHNYIVTTLKTQYRSVPAIGNIFSNFAYGGILKHAREDKDRRPLNINDWLEVQTLNIIKFPVKEYESIYRSRRLKGASAYQIYSAIFTFEFVKALSNLLEKNNSKEKFTVGIISPYRAQADIIEKLFAARKNFDRVDIQVGTVHTFQGDECDILFAVFNTPPGISSSPEMFLNRLNIINVAISRARDYLFIVMPDDDTDKIDNIYLVKRVEALFGTEGYGEFSARKIEECMFGKDNHIEENSFSTGHQNVNVYTRPERRYEIRSEDNAVDVQLHEN